MAVAERTQQEQRAGKTVTAFEEVYFDVQAELDFTKHPGALDATNELIDLCAIDSTKHVLDVGCGVGMTPAYLVKQTGCHVSGLDLRSSMVQRAKERADLQELGDQATFVVADARFLPFEPDTFDVVMAESVFALIAEQDRAMVECVRVVKVGGNVGIAETNWRKPPPPGFMERLSGSFGQMVYVLEPEAWQKLLERAGLHNVVARNHPISMRAETRGRIQRIGMRNMLRIWRRFFTIAWTQPKYRQFVKEALSEPMELVRYWGYGIYVGQKESLPSAMLTSG